MRALSIVLILAAAPAAAQQTERVPAPVPVTGSVFLDRNGNGRRDPGEPGVAGAAVSDQVGVVITDREGRFSLEAAGYGIVFLSEPDGHRSQGRWWRRVEPGATIEFPVVVEPSPRTFSFIHASDTHLAEETVGRIRGLARLADSLRPAFVLITGDLVRDALRTPEAEARRYYDLLMAELAKFPVPVRVVPGNHEIFAIERHRSLVPDTHPLYGKRMFRSYLGPNYYSFSYGGVHFQGLDTVDYFDLWYQGHVDQAQLAWIAADAARLPPGMPVVTFNHIPLASAEASLTGIDEESVAPTIIEVGGRPYFRHSVRNNDAVLAAIGDRLALALGGHIHRRESVTLETQSGRIRFHQAAAVVGAPPAGTSRVAARSGVTLYRVVERRIDEGTFLPLDPDPKP